MLRLRIAVLLVSSFCAYCISGLTVEVTEPFPQPGEDVTVVCEGEFGPFDIAVLGKQTAETGGFFETISANDRLIGKYDLPRFSLTQTIVGTTRTISLHISGASNEDTAIYVCIDSEGGDSASAVLEVTGPPSSISFNEYEEGQVISGEDGDSISITCVVEEVVPDPNVQLLAGGSVITPEDLSVTSVIDPRCTEATDDCLLHYYYEVTLSTSNFVLSRYHDEQTIQCRAESSGHWEAVYSTLLADVTYAPYSDSPSSQEVWLGQTDVTLSLVINSNPQLSSPVTLTAFGQDIPPDTPVFGVVFTLESVSPKQVVASIHFAEIMAFHFGGYIFTAINDIGSLSMQLNVIQVPPVIETTAVPEPTTQDPDFGRITISSSRALPDPGEALIIRCDLSSRFSTDVQIWKSISDDPTQNGQLVSNNEDLSPAYSGTGRHQVVYSEINSIRTYQLFISDTTYEETAYYSCLAVTENDFATTLVEVNEGPNTIQFVGHPNNGSISVVDGEAVSLDCAITAVAPIPRIRIYVGEEVSEEFESNVTVVPKCYPPTDDCLLHFNYDAVAYTRNWALDKSLNNVPVICQALYPPTNETLASTTLWLDVSFVPFTDSQSQFNASIGQQNFSALFNYKYNPDLTDAYLLAFGQMIQPGNTVFGVTFAQQKLGNQESNFFINISQVMEFHFGTYQLATVNSLGLTQLAVVLNQVEAPITTPTPPSTSQFPPTTTRNPDVVTISLPAYPREGDNVTVRCWQRHANQAFFLNLRKQTSWDGGDNQQVAINNILFEPYASTGRHFVEAFWNTSLAEVRLTIFGATIQDTAFYHCYSSLDETVDVLKSEVVHSPLELSWEGFPTNGTVSAYYRDQVELECWARNVAATPRLMVYVDGSTQFNFRTSSFQRNYCVGESSPDCLLHFAYDGLTYNDAFFRLERSYHRKALQCVSSGANQDTMESLLFMNVTTEPYTDTYNYFYQYEGTQDFSMVFDIRFNPDLIYDVKWYSRNKEMYFAPGELINGSMFYDEVVDDNQRLVYFNITEIEDHHFDRYTLETGNELGNMSLYIYLNSLGTLPAESMDKSPPRTHSAYTPSEHYEIQKVDSNLFEKCEIPDCKHVKQLKNGKCHCLDEIDDFMPKYRMAPKLDTKSIAGGMNQLFSKSVH